MTRKLTQIEDALMLAPASLSDVGKKIWNQVVRDPNFVGFSSTVTRRLLSTYCNMTEKLGDLESNLIGNKLLLSADRQEAASEAIGRALGPGRQMLAETKSRLFKRASRDELN
jgi:hypothetical protein